MVKCKKLEIKNSNGNILKPTVFTPDGRSIVAGDGLIAQIERFESKTVYAKLNVGVLNLAISTLTQKSDQPTGNTYTVICNELFWNEIQTTLSDYLRSFRSAATYLYSIAKGARVKIAEGRDGVHAGATYCSYELGGNTIMFIPDRALSREYADKQYAIMIDMSADVKTGNPALQTFTLEGQDLVQSKYVGHGGLDGKTSGIVSSPVAGSSFIVSGFAGIGVFAPYKSHIFIQS